MMKYKIFLFLFICYFSMDNKKDLNIIKWNFNNIYIKYNIEIIQLYYILSFKILKENLNEIYYLSIEEIKSQNNYFNKFNTLEEIIKDINEKYNNNNLNLKEDNFKIYFNYNNGILFYLNKNNNNNNDLILSLSNKIYDLSKIISYQSSIISTFSNKINNLENILNVFSLLSNDDMNLLKNFISPTNLNEIDFKLIYKKFLHGIDIQNYHNLIDNQGPTITIIKTKDNFKFGAYTTQNIDISDLYKIDENAFLFSLNLKEKYNTKDKYHSIKCYNKASEVNFFGKGPDLDPRDLIEGNLNPKTFLNDLRLNNNKSIFYIEDMEVYKVIFKNK